MYITVLVLQLYIDKDNKIVLFWCDIPSLSPEHQLEPNRCLCFGLMIKSCKKDAKEEDKVTISVQLKYIGGVTRSCKLMCSLSCFALST